ncbi:MAG TPA: hypothetical protein VIQ05_23215 [Tardiphaga sp.]
MTPAEASQRLSELKNSPEWRDKWFAGSVTAKDEFRQLTEAIAMGDDPEVDLAMAGQIDVGMIDVGGRRAMHSTAEMLRSRGIDDGPIRDLLLNKAVTSDDYKAAQRQKDALLRSHDFSAKFLSGDGDARKQMTDLDMILSRPMESPSS